MSTSFRSPAGKVSQMARAFGGNSNSDGSSQQDQQKRRRSILSPSSGRINANEDDSPSASGSGGDDIALESVIYGDIVYLRGLVNETTTTGYLHADSCFERVGFQTDPASSYVGKSSAPIPEVKNFQDCLFQVRLQHSTQLLHSIRLTPKYLPYRQSQSSNPNPHRSPLSKLLCNLARVQITPMLNYESTSTKLELTRRPSFSSSKAEQEMVETRIAQENMQNSQILENMAKGTDNRKVLYGQVVQLRHVATGRFLKANTSTAQCEKDCLRASVSDGDDLCQFRIMPRFKVRNEGSAAYYGDMVQLTNEKLPGYSIRISPKAYDEEEPKPLVHELNVSQEASSMKLIKYRRPDKDSKSFVHTNSDLVRFFHAESECFLAASCNSGKKKHVPYLRKIKNIIPGDDENISIKGIFVFEYTTVKSSDSVLWDTNIKIRHLATNKYVRVIPKPVTGNNYGCELVDSTADNNDSLTFLLAPTDVQGAQVPSTQVSMRIEHQLKDSKGRVQKTLHMSSCSKAKNAHQVKLQQKSFDMIFSTVRGDNDAFVLMPLSQTAPFAEKIESVLTAIPTLRWFADRVITPNSVIRRADVDKMETLFSKLIYHSDLFFSKEKYTERLSQHDYEPSDALNFNNASSPVFQDIARDAKLMDAIFDVCTCATKVKGLSMRYNEV